MNQLTGFLNKQDYEINNSKNGLFLIKFVRLLMELLFSFNIFQPGLNLFYFCQIKTIYET
jgi:hypothetical protein